MMSPPRAQVWDSNSGQGCAVQTSGQEAGRQSLLSASTASHSDRFQVFTT